MATSKRKRTPRATTRKRGKGTAGKSTSDDTQPTASESSASTPVLDKFEGMRDVRLAERALRERFPMRPEVRASLLDMLTTIAYDKNASRRERIRAATALLQADRLNLEAARLELDVMGVTSHAPAADVTVNVQATIAAFAERADFQAFARQRLVDASTNGNGHASSNGSKTQANGQANGRKQDASKTQANGSNGKPPQANGKPT